MDIEECACDPILVIGNISRGSCEFVTNIYIYTYIWVFKTGLKRPWKVYRIPQKHRTRV